MPAVLTPQQQEQVKCRYAHYLAEKDQRIQSGEGRALEEEERRWRAASSSGGGNGAALSALSAATAGGGSLQKDRNTRGVSGSFLVRNGVGAVIRDAQASEAGHHQQQHQEVKTNLTVDQISGATALFLTAKDVQDFLNECYATMTPIHKIERVMYGSKWNLRPLEVIPLGVAMDVLATRIEDAAEEARQGRRKDTAAMPPRRQQQGNAMVVSGGLSVVGGDSPFAASLSSMSSESSDLSDDGSSSSASSISSCENEDVSAGDERRGIKTKTKKDRIDYSRFARGSAGAAAAQILQLEEAEEARRKRLRGLQQQQQSAGLGGGGGAVKRLSVLSFASHGAAANNTNANASAMIMNRSTTASDVNTSLFAAEGEGEGGNMKTTKHHNRGNQLLMQAIYGPAAAAVCGDVNSLTLLDDGDAGGAAFDADGDDPIRTPRVTDLPFIHDEDTFLPINNNATHSASSVGRERSGSVANSVMAALSAAKKMMAIAARRRSSAAAAASAAGGGSTSATPSNQNLLSFGPKLRGRSGSSALVGVGGGGPSGSTTPQTDYFSHDAVHLSHDDHDDGNADDDDDEYDSYYGGMSRLHDALVNVSEEHHMRLAWLQGPVAALLKAKALKPNRPSVMDTHGRLVTSRNSMVASAASGGVSTSHLYAHDGTNKKKYPQYADDDDDDDGEFYDDEDDGDDFDEAENDDGTIRRRRRRKRKNEGEEDDGSVPIYGSLRRKVGSGTSVNTQTHEAVSNPNAYFKHVPSMVKREEMKMEKLLIELSEADPEWLEAIHEQLMIAVGQVRSGGGAAATRPSSALGKRLSRPTSAATSRQARPRSAGGSGGNGNGGARGTATTGVSGGGVPLSSSAAGRMRPKSAATIRRGSTSQDHHRHRQNISSVSTIAGGDEASAASMTVDLSSKANARMNRPFSAPASRGNSASASTSASSFGAPGPSRILFNNNRPMSAAGKRKQHQNQQQQVQTNNNAKTTSNPPPIAVAEDGIYEDDGDSDDDHHFEARGGGGGRGEKGSSSHTHTHTHHASTMRRSDERPSSAKVSSSTHHLHSSRGDHYGAASMRPTSARRPLSAATTAASSSIKKNSNNPSNPQHREWNATTSNNAAATTAASRYDAATKARDDRKIQILKSYGLPSSGGRGEDNATQQHNHNTPQVSSSSFPSSSARVSTKVAALHRTKHDASGHHKNTTTTTTVSKSRPSSALGSARQNNNQHNNNTVASQGVRANNSTRRPMRNDDDGNNNARRLSMSSLSFADDHDDSRHHTSASQQLNNSRHSTLRHVPHGTIFYIGHPIQGRTLLTTTNKMLRNAGGKTSGGGDAEHNTTIAHTTNNAPTNTFSSVEELRSAIIASAPPMPMGHAVDRIEMILDGGEGDSRTEHRVPLTADTFPFVPSICTFGIVVSIPESSLPDKERPSLL